MPDWRNNEIEDNIRDGFAESSCLDLDASNKKSRHELDSTRRTDLTGNHNTVNNNAFGVITKPFENGPALVARDPVENEGNGVSYGENDLAYYDWPTIDNFEDVDKLFRNCDLTFGQGQTVENGEEELSWFPTSSDSMYTLEMDTLNELSAYSSRNPGPHASADAEVEDALASSQMECEGEEREELAADLTYNGSSLNGYGTLDMIGNPHLSVQSITQDLVDQNSSLASPSKLSNSPLARNQRHQVESGSSSYITFSSYPGTEGTPSSVGPPAQKKPSVAKKVEKLKTGQMMNSIQEPLTEKHSFQGTNCKNKFERGTNESKSILDSSLVVNGSSNNNNSAFSVDDPSVEETSFRQLQDVMNQLDLKTKLSIRDALYRLARGAQQRNGFSNASSYDNGDVQYSAMNNGFLESMNPETGTNPIDRSIAELLFYQPPGPTTRNIEEATSLKSCVSNEHNNHAPVVVIPCTERKADSHS